MTASNVHGTAIVVGTTGLLFVGASGSGKSSLALECLCAARDLGVFSALVGDDQVLLSRSGDRLIARGPDSIRGRLELRGAGIVAFAFIEAAVLSHAIAPLQPPFTDRIPPEEERWTSGIGFDLPLLRLPYEPGISALNRLRTILPEIIAIS